MIEITVTGLDGVYEALDRLQENAVDMRPAWMLIEQFLADRTAENYRTETSPDGAKWKPLSEKYKRSKRKRESKGANRILVLDYIMIDSYESRINPLSMEFGTNDFKAAFHQFGYGVPKREHLGVSDNDLPDIADIIERHLLSGVG